jgi:hypothetical protein
LTASEVAAISEFCELRGGAVVIVPDRPPSGPFARLVSPSGFDERLLDKPVVLVGSSTIGVSASEFALPRRPGPGAIVVASMPPQDSRAVMVSLPRGRGRILFSGALDAWRFRARGGDAEAFTRFWTGLIANLAAASSRRVSVSVEPALAAPGERMNVRAVIDATAFPSSRSGEGPAVSASLVARDGEQHFVRLWPAAEPWVFEGETVAPAAGWYDARVTVAGVAADTPVMVADGVRHPPAYQEESLRLVATATGGVVVTAADLAPLRRHLDGVARRDEARTIHPMRSGWWSVPFITALCAEWAARRRRGAR